MQKLKSVKRKRGRPLDPITRILFTQNFAATITLATDANHKECESFFSIGDQSSKVRKGETWRKYLEGKRGVSQGVAVQRTLKLLTVPFRGHILGDVHLIESLLDSYPHDSFDDAQRKNLLNAFQALDPITNTFDVSPPGKGISSGALDFFTHELRLLYLTEGIPSRLRPKSEERVDESPYPHEQLEQSLRKAAAALAALGKKDPSGWWGYLDEEESSGSLIAELRSNPDLKAWWVANHYLSRALGFEILSLPERKKCALPQGGLSGLKHATHRQSRTQEIAIP